MDYIDKLRDRLVGQTISDVLIPSNRVGPVCQILCSDGTSVTIASGERELIVEDDNISSISGMLDRVHSYRLDGPHWRDIFTKSVGVLPFPIASFTDDIMTIDAFDGTLFHFPVIHISDPIEQTILRHPKSPEFVPYLVDVGGFWKTFFSKNSKSYVSIPSELLVY